MKAREEFDDLYSTIDQQYKAGEPWTVMAVNDISKWGFVVTNSSPPAIYDNALTLKEAVKVYARYKDVGELYEAWAYYGELVIRENNRRKGK